MPTPKKTAAKRTISKPAVDTSPAPEKPELDAAATESVTEQPAAEAAAAQEPDTKASEPEQEASEKEAPPTAEVINVIAVSTPKNVEKFRRCGLTFTPEQTILRLDEVPKEVVKALRSEPMLKVEIGTLAQ